MTQKKNFIKFPQLEFFEKMSLKNENMSKT